jgi:hypothetical protein
MKKHLYQMKLKNEKKLNDIKIKTNEEIKEK